MNFSALPLVFGVSVLMRICVRFSLLQATAQAKDLAQVPLSVITRATVMPGP